MTPLFIPFFVHLNLSIPLAFVWVKNHRNMKLEALLPLDEDKDVKYMVADDLGNLGDEL